MCSNGYKTGDGVAEELLSQFDLAERAASALGIVVWPMVEFEADDAIATAAFRWWQAEGVDQVVICSPDKDLMQMARSQRIVSLDRRKELVIDESGVVEKFGVGPGSIPRLSGPGRRRRRRYSGHSQVGRQVYGSGTGSVRAHRADT